VTDHHDFPEIECLEQLGQVIGVLVHVIALPRLAGTPVPAPIVGDATVTTRPQEEHLGLPGIG
jgi:hypothetical protein